MNHLYTDPAFCQDTETRQERPASVVVTKTVLRNYSDNHDFSPLLACPIPRLTQQPQQQQQHENYNFDTGQVATPNSTAAATLSSITTKTSTAARMPEEAALDASTTTMTPQSPPAAAAAAATTCSLHGFQETPDFIELSLRHMQEAIQMIPYAEKKDYLEAAAQRGQEFMLQESHPVKFLRTTDFNAWAAARRLAKYWEYRRQVFGNGKWLRPFTVDPVEDGPLNELDLELMTSGMITPVPLSAFSATAGGFLLIDRSKYHERFRAENLYRVTFFMSSVRSNEIAQRVGVTMVRLLGNTTQRGTSELLRTISMVHRMAQEASPVKMRKSLVLDLDGGTRRGDIMRFFQQRVNTILANVYGFNMPQAILIKSRTEACSKLQEFGLPRDCVPVSHGGTWTDDRMREWNQSFGWFYDHPSQRPMQSLVQRHGMSTAANRISSEKRARRHRPSSKAQSDDNDSAKGSQGDTQSRSTRSCGSSSKRKNEADLSMVPSAIYNRRAYNKRKSKHAQLQRDAKRLRAENEILAQEGARLEGLVSQALEIVSLLDPCLQ